MKSKTKIKPEASELPSTSSMPEYRVRLDGQGRDRARRIKALHASVAAEIFGRSVCEENDCTFVDVLVTKPDGGEMAFEVRRVVVYQSRLLIP